jgi:L,D-transpeptidase catalytic domain
MRALRPVAAAFAAVCFFAVLSVLPASAAIVIDIDKSAQRMTVSQDGVQLYAWPVSTGQRGYDTPSGEFKPFRMEKTHFSREWDDAPMPNSIFFTTRGHAIHGTNHIRNIGRPASHGCVRLEPENASVLFSLVKKEGMANVRVVLSGVTPGGGGPAMVRRAPRTDDDVTGSVEPSRVTREYGTQINPWNSNLYDRRYQAVPPPPPRFYGRNPWD